MNQEITIEKLQISDKSEIVDFFGQVFKDKSFSIKFVQAYYDMFKGNEHRLFIHGIRKDNKLVCLSISCDTLGELSWLGCLRSVFRLSPLSSFTWLCEVIRELFTREQKKHPLSKEIHYTARYFEIACIETLYPYKDQGLEQMMLHYLCQKAKREGFKGVFHLPVDKENPLYRACLDEGFKEIPKEEMFLEKGSIWKVLKKGEDEYGISWCGMILVFQELLALRSNFPSGNFR